jgi:cytochrome P450
MLLGVAVVLGLVLLLAILLTRKKKSIIGYHRTDLQHGNKAEIVQEGGFYSFIANSHKRFGPVFEFWTNEHHSVSICSVEMFKAVKHLDFRPLLNFDSLMPLIGNQSILLINGDEYTRRRRHLHTPFFSMSSIHQNLVPKLNEQITSDVLPFFEARANSGQPSQIAEVCVNFTVKAIAYLIGSQADRSDVQTIIDCHNIVLEALFAGSNGVVLSKEENDDFEAKLRLMKSVMKKLITEAKISESASLMKVYANETDEVVQDDMMSFLVAGFHTTSNLIQFALYLAAKYPDEQERVYRELMAVEGDLSAKVESLPILRNFVDEVLRWAGVSILAIRVNKDSDIELPGGYVIRKDTAIFMPLALIQQDETLWDRPSEFIPDRFNDPESRGLKFCGFSFAGGRSCPGKSMALTEAKIFIAEVFRRFVVSLPSPNYSIKKNYVFVIRPVDPIELIVTRR